MNIRGLRSARRTVADGIRFYEGQEAEDLRRRPSKYDNFYYRMVCQRFPYSIYYRKERMDVQVYAVLDDHRDPEATKSVLENSGLES